MAAVHFSCQRCCQPLRLHSSLQKISKEALLDLTTRNALTKRSVEERSKLAHDMRLMTIGEEVHEDYASNCDEPSTSSLASLASSSRDSKTIVFKKIPSIRGNESFSDIDYSVIQDLNQPPGPKSAAEISSSLLTGFDHSKLVLEQETRRRGRDSQLQIQLFDILSDQSDIDHPLCEECADFVIDQMGNQLAVLEKEYQEYQDYLTQIELLEVASDPEIEKLKERLREAQIAQAKKIEELKKLNKEQKKLDDELARHSNDLRRLKLEEDKYWQEYNSVKFSLLQSEDELETLENKSKAAKELYDRLKKTNIFNAAFYIWVDKDVNYGCINGFRLGRLAGTNAPDWNEINAAWGQCALLLSSLANKIGLTFQRYKIVAYGNYSFIESLEDKTRQLPLYTSGGSFKLNMFHQKFDQAMVAYIDCLFQFDKETYRIDQFQLPYKMDTKGYILDKTTRWPVKYSASNDSQWTTAMKYMLTNLKWALAWVSNNHKD